MKIERFEQAHQLAEGQLVTDAKGELWKVAKYHEETWLTHFSDEYAFSVKPTGETYVLGDDAPLPWSTVKVVPDDDLPRPVLEPCPVCGFADWPEGGMHAARSIHMRAHQQIANIGDPPVEQTIRRQIANDLRQAATIMESASAAVYREIALHIEHGRRPVAVTSSTMCGGCGDMQQLMSDASFVPHTNRRTGEPCPGEPGIPTADAAARWRQFCAGLDQPELWR